MENGKKNRFLINLIRLVDSKFSICSNISFFFMSFLFRNALN